MSTPEYPQRHTHGGNLHQLSVAAGVPATQLVDFSANINPLGPPEWLRPLISASISDLAHYPDPDCTELITALARANNLHPEQILVGNGATELLHLLPRAMEVKRALVPVPSYADYEDPARLNGLEVTLLPLSASEQFRLDTTQLEAALQPEQLVLLGQPNNPTGAPILNEEIVALAEAVPPGAVLMVDQAYHDFLPDGDLAFDLVSSGAPILVLRTFSKAYGMAGLRLGYAIGSDQVLARLRTVWWGDYGINTATRIAGPVALADQEHVGRYIKLIDEGLAQLRSGLIDLGAKPYPYRAPFFMVDFGRPTMDLVRSLYNRQIYVRPGAVWGMPNFMRISVGTAEDNATFLNAIKKLLKS